MGRFDELLRRAGGRANTRHLTEGMTGAASERTSVDARWLPEGQSVPVAGRIIPGGMLYQADGPAPGHRHDPAVIDSTLAVAWNKPDTRGTNLPYWPSYSTISPAARAAYLQWLIGGRSAPDTPLGYVFLFFYGLERRCLVDLNANSTHPEVTAIAAEVRRLYRLYGSNESFHRYATNFLELIDAAEMRTARLAPPDWRATGFDWELPFELTIGLGRYVAAHRPIPAEWALSFLRLHPEARLRTPAKRCSVEFDELFLRRYRTKFGDGMRVRPPKARITLDYQPASSSLRNYTMRFDDIPDITGMNGPFQDLRTIAFECTDSLDSYSRYLGKNPGAVGTPAAVALLPAELIDTHGGTVADRVRAWVDEAVGDGPTLVPRDALIRAWSPNHPVKLTKNDALALTGLLANVGVGIEPDVRFGGSPPPPGATVVLFPAGADAPSQPSPQYSAAAVLVHLAAAVAAADGTVDDDERRHLKTHLERTFGLSSDERVRLDAHLEWLAANSAGLAGVKRRLDVLDESRRAAIGQFLVEFASAGGTPTAAEIATLTKIYRLLGLDEGDVYVAVHRHGMSNAPVPVRQADEGTRYLIPEPTSAATTGSSTPVTIDPDKVQARLAETAEVAALLAGIFTDDDPDTTPPVPETTATITHEEPVDVQIDGLDDTHVALVVELTGRDLWDRAAVEDLVAAVGLPLFGAAIDRINEAAIDMSGEPLLEGDDPIEVNSYAAEELLR